MARQPTHYIIPESGRVSTTLSKRDLKEIRKISIDLGVPEQAVLKLAVQALIEKYRSLSGAEIDERGIGCFLEHPETFIPGASEEQ